MYFLNGSINIKNILILSFLVSTSISIIFLSNHIKKSDLKITFDCRPVAFIDVENFKKDINQEKIRDEFKKICEGINFDFETSNIYYFEQDNQTYLLNFNQLLIYNALVKEINDKYNSQNLNKKIKKRSVNFKLFIKSGEFDLLNDQGKKLFVLRYLKETQIKQLDIVKSFSSIYSKLFNDTKYGNFFILALNFLILAITIFFITLILKKLFPNLSKTLLILISLNVFSLPIFLIYYLSFYKEPIILLSIIILIYNFVFFYSNKESLKNFILLTFLILLAYILIVTLKYNYSILFLSAQILTFLILFLKNKKIHYFYFLQIIIVGFYIFKPNYILYLSSNSFDKTDLNEFVFETSENKKDIAFEEKIQRIEKEKYLKKNLNNQFFPKPDIIKISKENYVYLNCNEKIIYRFCEKLNNFLYKISSVKRATLYENSFYDKINFNENIINFNENIINAHFYKSATSILKQIPISILKGFYMPILFNSKIFVVMISIFKLTIFILFGYVLYSLLIGKKYHKFLLLIGFITFFVPILLAIDLVTSNFFTYFRYTFPYNVTLTLIIISYFISLKFSKENDKYNN